MYADKYGNGIGLRPVFYNGKAWYDHMVLDGGRKGRHHVSVKADSGQAWPMSFGPHLLVILKNAGYDY